MDGGTGVGPGISGNRDTLKKSGWQQWQEISRNRIAFGLQKPLFLGEQQVIGQLSPGTCAAPSKAMWGGDQLSSLALGTAAVCCGVSFIPICCIVAWTLKLCTKPVVSQPLLLPSQLTLEVMGRCWSTCGAFRIFPLKGRFHLSQKNSPCLQLRPAPQQSCLPLSTPAHLRLLTKH